ncbi:MAG TPA: hypothetical protein PLU10_04890 [Chitinophagaceae bacterium]|nr:hypothetical protein [Chitinophagaceae bacterium]
MIPDKLPSLAEHELKPWFEKGDMIVACIAQLKKDVGAYGIHIEVSGNPLTAYTEMAAQLEPQLKVLLSKETSLQALLYRIDLDERAVKSIDTREETFTSALTRLILWRELQKVVTRKIMSQEKK